MRLFTKPIPRRFRHTAITTQQIIDRFINRDMSLWNSRSCRNQYFDDLSIKLRVSSVSRRPKGLSQHSSIINMLYFKRRVLFQQELDCLQLTTNRRTMQWSLSVTPIPAQIHIFVQ